MRLSSQNIGMEISINQDLAKNYVDKMYEVFATVGEDMPKYLNDAICDLQIQLDNLAEEGGKLNENGERVFQLVYVDEALDARDNVDGETVEMTVSEILAMVNDDECHSDDFIPYDETDWIDGVLNFSSYDLILLQGDVMNHKGTEAVVKAKVRLTGGFGKEMTIVVTDKGEHVATDLS